MSITLADKANQMLGVRAKTSSNTMLPPQGQSCHASVRFSKTVGVFRNLAVVRSQRCHVKTCATSKDPAAQLVEGVATLAIQSRLKSFTDVKFDVDANGLGLLTGRVERAQMTGLGWESPLGLSARSLDINVGVTTLDYPALLTEQRIKLSNQPHGSARCLFDEADFGRFLTHPLVMQATAKAVRGSPFVFDANSVVVHAPSSGEKPGTQGPQSQASAAAAASSVVHPTGTKATSASGAAVAGEVVGHLNQPSQDSLPSLADVNLPQGPTLTPPVMQPLSTPPSSSGSSSLSGPSPMHTHKKSELTGLGMDEAIGDPYFDPHAAGSAVTTGYITCTGTWRGQKYSLTLQPWGGPGAAVGGAKHSVLVHARHMPHARSAHVASELGPAADSSTDQIISDESGVEEAADEEAVSLELSYFFSNLMVDLQGAELTFGSMSMLPPSHPDVVRTARACGVRYPGGQAAVSVSKAGTQGRSPAGPGASNVAAVQDAVAGIANLIRANVMSNQYPHNDAGRHATPTGPWLDLRLALRVREFPPLNLKF